MAFTSKVLGRHFPLGRLLSYQALYESPVHNDIILPKQSVHEGLLEKLSGNTKNTIENMMNGAVKTYDDIALSSLKVASKLKSCGVQPGDHVMLYSPNNENYTSAFLALMSIGAIPCLANPAYTEYELGALCKSSDITHIISSDVNEATAKAVSSVQDIPLLCNVDNLSEFAAGCSPLSDLHHAELEDVAVIGYSSGTTGLPKGVQLTHGNLNAERLIIGHKDFFPNSVQDNQLLLMPWYHAYGFTQLGMSIEQGSDVKMLTNFDPVIFLKTAQQHRPRMLGVVPPILLFMAKHPVVSKFDLSSVEEIICGAAPLKEDTIKELKARHPHIHECRQGYGMTETTAAHCTQRVGTANDSVGSVGVPLPFCSLKIVNPETDEIVTDGGEGEILMAGPVIMKGYYKNDKANAATLTSDGFVRSGDVGTVDKNGFLYITDRLKELIKVKGYQVAPAELEGVLSSHPGIAEAAVIGVPDSRAGEVPKAFVAVNPGVNISEEDVKNFIASRMSAEKHLASVEFMEEIPKLPSGKILKKDLRKLEESRRK